MIYGKRLREADYQELTAKKTVSEVAEYLKQNTHYASLLENIDTATIHRGHLEMLLRKNLFELYKKLCKFQQLDKQPFFRFQILHSEIRELLRAILYMNCGENDAYITTMPSYLMDFTTFPLLELARANTFPELLTIIRDTPYYAALRDIPVQPDGRVDYTKCERNLRTFYLKWMFETIQNEFHGAARTALLDQLEVQTDLINIINAYRMKTYFHATAEQLADAMLPFSGRLPKRRMQELYEAGSTDAFMHLFLDTIYGKQVDAAQIQKDAAHFERALTRLRCDLATRSLTFSQGAAVSLYSIVFLLENELNNIITIIEGIRYEKSVSYIEELLVVH